MFSCAALVLLQYVHATGHGQVWHYDYATALEQAKAAHKPLAVFIGSKTAGWHDIAQEGRLSLVTVAGVGYRKWGQAFQEAFPGIEVEQQQFATTALWVPKVSPERYLLLVESGDEVLDYRRAVSRYAGAQQCVVEGGDHSLQPRPRGMEPSDGPSLFGPASPTR